MASSKALSQNFYGQLPFLPDFNAVADEANFHPLPDDWVLLATDIMDSTGHIAAGEYKNINLIGASCITAVLNALGRADVPFFFGGDGAQIACPSAESERCLQVLRGVARRAGEAFNFRLRVAGFSAGSLRAEGYDLKVARLRLAPELSQALFSGNGLPEVDRRLKQQDAAGAKDEPVAEPDLAGLECRWKQIPSTKGEIISLLVQVLPGPSDPGIIYRSVLDRISEILGRKEERHPLRQEVMELDCTAEGQRAERDLTGSGQPALIRASLKLLSQLAMRMGNWVLRHRVRMPGVDWGEYFDEVVQFSDSEKFNGMLSMVAACSRPNREVLENYLEEKCRAGELVYGLHVSQAALLTCMVFDRKQRHVHFVDGADGGYAMAAKQLKGKLEILAQARNG